MYYRLLALVLPIMLTACQESNVEATPEVEALIEQTTPVEEIMEEVKENAESMTEEAPAPENKQAGLH